MLQQQLTFKDKVIQAFVPPWDVQKVDVFMLPPAESGNHSLLKLTVRSAQMHIHATQ